MTHLANLTISSSGVTATHTDFPKLVRGSDFTANIWSTATSSGGDLRFFLSDGTTEIAREIVSFDNVSEEAEIWIKIPSVSALSNTVVQIHGDGTSSDYAATGTYGRNNVWSSYESVYHFQDNPSSGTLTDAAGNYDMSTLTSMSSGDSIDGPGSLLSAWQFTSSGSEGANVDYSAGDTSVWVMSAWAKPLDSSPSSGQGITFIGDKDDTNERGLIRTNSSGVSSLISNGSVTSRNAVDTITDDTWSHLVYASTNTDVDLFANGVKTTDSPGGTLALVGVDRLAVGYFADSTPGGYYTGGLAEVRFGRGTSFTDGYFTDQYADQNGDANWHSIAAVGGGSDTNVSVSSASLTLTEQAAGVTYDVDVLTTSVALTLTENPASIGTTSNVEVSVDPAAFTLTPLTSSISLDRDVSVSSVSFTLTENPASVGVDGSVNVTVNTASLSLATQTANIIRDINIEAGVTSLTFNTYQASTGLTNFTFINYYNGSTFVQGVLKRWDGSTWVDEHNMKRWNGSAWVIL